MFSQNRLVDLIYKVALFVMLKEYGENLTKCNLIMKSLSNLLKKKN